MDKHARILNLVSFIFFGGMRFVVKGFKESSFSFRFFEDQSESERIRKTLPREGMSGLYTSRKSSLRLNVYRQRRHDQSIALISMTIEAVMHVHAISFLLLPGRVISKDE